MSLGPKPSFGTIWTGDFPFDEWNDSKHRTLLVLAYRASSDEVFAVKVSSTGSYSIAPGEFGVYGSDKFFEKTGLHRDSKVVFNSLAVIPVAKLVKQIGILEINDRKTSNRVMQAVRESRYASAIATAIRSFG
jgi:hypothetical protein